LWTLGGKTFILDSKTVRSHNGKLHYVATKTETSHPFSLILTKGFTGDEAEH